MDAAKPRCFGLGRSHFGGQVPNFQADRDCGHVIEASKLIAIMMDQLTSAKPQRAPIFELSCRGNLRTYYGCGT